MVCALVQPRTLFWEEREYFHVLNNQNQHFYENSIFTGKWIPFYKMTIDDFIKKKPIKTWEIKELLLRLDWNARWQVKSWRVTSSLSLTFFSFFGSLFNLVHRVIVVDKPGCGHTWHASQEPLGHLVEKEPKETWAARGKLAPRDHVVLMERKEQRESLESRVPLDKKDSEGTKATVERLDWLHTWTGRSVLGKRDTTQIQDWYM